MAFFRRKKKNKNWQDRNPRLWAKAVPKNQPKKKSRFGRFLFWVLLLGLAGVVIYFLLFSSQIEINSLVVTGNQEIPSSEIAARASDALVGKYLKIFAKNNFFFARPGDISANLKRNFNRLEVTSIKKKFPDTLYIEVKERQPEIVWCSGGVCYLVDKSGLIYAGANLSVDELKNTQYLTIVDDNSRPVDIGLTNIGQKFVENFKQIDAILTHDLSFTLADVYHTPAIASQEIYVKIGEPESDGWILKINSDITPAETKKVIQTVLDGELAGDKLKSLDYLDLSVRGKIYYKLR